MAQQRLSMRKIVEILRLSHECSLSNRQIAHSLSLGRTTVADYLSRAAAAGLGWPLPDGMDGSSLEQLLFPGGRPLTPITRQLPDWPTLHQELKRKGVTLRLLWEEYKSGRPDGYQYSQFCALYRRWRSRIDLSMRQAHRAGEKLFVDYSGQTVAVTSASSGEVREAEIFVAVLGASNYTFAEATWGQTLPDWISSHQRAFAFFGGVPELVVVDNLKSGVTKSCRYEPDLNPTYQEMISHYSTAVMPARVRAPKDKSKVEAGVQLVERWILARLRHRQFFSLDELNGAVGELLERLNNQPFQKLPGTRRSTFESLDRPALRPLPDYPYEYAEWKKAKVNLDYHVEVGRHYYSVPYQMVGQKLDLRITASTIECFRETKRVASHRRSERQGGYTTLPEHMPASHREYLKWTPERILDWAEKTGPHAAKLAKVIIENRSHPQQGFRSVLGILRLTKTYGHERVESACRRALAINAASFKGVQAILKNGLDQRPLPAAAPITPPVIHPNIRGAEYYANNQGGDDAQTTDRGPTDVAEASRHESGTSGTDADARRQLAYV